MVKDYPLVSIVIPNFNGRNLLERCLKCVFKSTYHNLEVILVDNASSDDSIPFVKKLFGGEGRLRIIKNKKNYFFAEGNNIGARRAKGKYIIVLSNDIEIKPSCLELLVETLEQDSTIGAAQAKILIGGQNRIIDNMGGNLDFFGFARGRGRLEKDRGQYDKIKEVFFAAGASFIVRKSIVEEVGLFDPAYFVHSEDVDLGWRIRLRGYRVVVVPQAVIYHKPSSSIKKVSWQNELSFHIRKNRLATLIKNYSSAILLLVLPLELLIYFGLFLIELLIKLTPRQAITSLKAIGWNLQNLSYLLEKRRKVQGKIRRVSDFSIFKMMSKIPLFT